MRKTYKKPALNIVKLNAELPMAASFQLYSDTTVEGADALGNTEGNFDIWKNDKSIW